MLTISERIAQTAEHVIYHDVHGYSQPNRSGDGTQERLTYSDGSQYVIHGGDYDCSELARVCVNCGITGNYSAPIKYMWTGNEYDELINVGFTMISPYYACRGDILLRNGHTEIHLGNGLCGGARIGDAGIDGVQGDQGGWEVTYGSYAPSEWRMAFTIYGSVGGSEQSEDEMICIIQPNEESGLVYIDGANAHPLAHPDESEAIQEIYRRTHNGAEIPIFKYGTPDAPWATRLFDALNRKM